MRTIPTPEQFERLSRAAEIYVTDFYDYLKGILGRFPDDKIPVGEVSGLVKLAVDAGDLFLNSSLGEDGVACKEWLESEPAFAMAIKAVGFHLVESVYWAELYEKTILNCVRHGTPTASLARRLARNTSRYLAYISQVGGALHSYTTGIGHRAAIDGPATIDRMRKLLSEFEQLVAIDWIPTHVRERLSYQVNAQSAISFLEGAGILDQPTSRRNDADLPARLLASELLRLNYRTFSNFHRRAVFNLMGLSIIERPLEMRTIERLAKSEMDADREYMAKRIADKRGLDFDHVLTTLKASKSLTFPS